MGEALKPAAEPTKRLSLNGESDILRRRLLGIKSEGVQQEVHHHHRQQEHQKQHQQHSLPPKPKFQPPTATITSQQLQKQVHPVVHLEEQPNLVNLASTAGNSIANANGCMPIDLRKPEQHPAVQQIQKANYTQKSVLKHLLYKWEHSGHTSATESSADESAVSANSS